MSTTIDRPTTTPTTVGLPARIAMIAAPGLVLAAHLVQSAPPAHDTASELASIAGAQGRYQAAAVLGFAAMVLYVPALLGLAAPVRRTRPGWRRSGSRCRSPDSWPSRR